MRQTFGWQVSVVSSASVFMKFVEILIGLYSEQEHNRTQESSDIDDRTMHEIYTQPFLKSIMAGVSSIMCSYSTLHFPLSCCFSLFFFRLCVLLSFRFY